MAQLKQHTKVGRSWWHEWLMPTILPTGVELEDQDKIFETSGSGFRGLISSFLLRSAT